jgi:hypothetical protein
MKRMGKLIGLLVMTAAFVTVPLTVPQSTSSEGYSCPDIVAEAFTATEEICDGTSRNQACYGHVLLDAEPQEGVEQFVFEEEGDIAEVFDIQSLRISAMDTDLGLYGVALMRLQASLSDSTSKKNITLLLFGQADVENAGVAATPLDVTVESARAINVRLLPSTDAVVVATVAPQAHFMATGRSEDSSWLRVQMEDGRTGWVKTSLLSTDGDVEMLDVVEPGSTYYGPMQAFYLQSGVDDAACPEAPNSGLLIQTPEGVAEVTFLINEVDIQLGSTVFFQAKPGAEMIISVVEGSAIVRAGGVAHRAIAGSQIVVVVDDKMHPIGAPSLPRPYQMDSVEALPIQLLEREIEIARPLTQDELAELLDEGQPDPAYGGGWQTAPGLDGAVPPGHEPGKDNDIPPGQIDNPSPKK